MRKRGLKESTVKNTLKALKVLARKTDIRDPERVREFIVGLEGKEGCKRNLAIAYDNYVKVNGLR